MTAWLHTPATNGIPLLSAELCTDICPRAVLLNYLLHPCDGSAQPFCCGSQNPERTDVFVLCFTAPMRIELQFVKADRCYPFHRTFTSLHLFGGQPAVMGCFRTFNLTPGGCFSSCSPNKVRILRADKSSIHVCLTLKPQATGKRFIYRRTTLGYIHEF